MAEAPCPGDAGVGFLAQPQNTPRNETWASNERWVHLAKVALKKYFMQKVRTGISEPPYERLALKALGIVRLKN
jgi:sulfide:quinone oxidoreductase